ncbi:MAG: DUF3078 domain-containing protein [Bacteroidales bacterium]|nr:DUF3078 domain-containing protein [Bacteroidales bacterium]MCF8403610.1 DUF3078 domain-containing protein [Bacteroidales bacterium]
MTKILLFFTGLLLTSVVIAQDADTSWKRRGDISLMFSQTSFTNWAPGGENNITMNGIFNYYAGYIKGKAKWETMLGLAYGQTKTGVQDYRKSEDKIDLQSIYGYQASEVWYYSANFNFKTQFAEGYNYHDGDPTIGKVKISNFLAPAYISIGPGMEYRPKEYLSFYFSPATAKWIIVNDQDLADAGSFGVEGATYEADSLGNPDLTKKLTDGEKSKFEMGAYFRFLFVKDIVKNVNLSTKLELFSDYLKDPQNVDVNWDTMINMKVNDWISANFGLQMVYDHDTPVMDKDGNIGPRTQIKQLLSVGLSYKFAGK